ncbi:MAG: ATP-binding cassette domain-containing protein, partial [Rhodobacteraceae bacterium]|nr:ATP-binding cassette domain-containing protein [Paracoccaceae bacterium]
MMWARLVVVAVPILVAAVSFLLPSYWVTLMTSAGMIALVCIGLGVMAGQAGIASFGQAAFVGVAAYTTAILTTQYGMSPWLSLFGSLAMTTAAAFVIGWVTVRLSGHFLVLGTIGWGVSFFYLLANIPAFGGYNGIGGLPALLPISGLEGRIAFNILVWLLVCLVALAFLNVLDSVPGRAIRAVRFKAMAESFGVDTARYKLAVFVLAAQAAGLAGWLQAHFLRFVNPNPFGLNASVEYMFVSIIGGVGHLLGGMIGAVVAIFTKSNLQSHLPGLIPVTGNYEIVAFGVLVLLLLHFAPSGITQWVPERLRMRAVAPQETGSTLSQRPKPEPDSVVLKASGVSKHFGGVIAVNDVSIEVRAAEIVAMVGPNGAGKSTLFDLVSGLTTVTSGEISLMGERVDGTAARAIVQKGVARTFQHAQLNEDMTVLENIALGGHLRQGSSVF